MRAVRLAGGDCVITFRSGTVDWTVPTNLKRVKILLVGGGGVSTSQLSVGVVARATRR